MTTLRVLIRACGAAAGVTLAGCAVTAFQPGTAQSEIRTAMGAPAAVMTARDGTTEWQYPQGPSGLHTYIARFDAQDRLRSWEQALDDDHFMRIRVGESTTADVKELVGPPWRTMDFPRKGETAWDYRYQDTWGYLVEYSVIFDKAGLVASKFPRRLNDGRDGGGGMN